MVELVDKTVLEKAGLMLVKISDNPDKLLTKFNWSDVPTISEAEIRNRAIDEFAEKLKQNFQLTDAHYGFIVTKIIEKLAEQLKEEREMSERGYVLSDREHQKFMGNYRLYCDEMRKAWEYLYGADGIHTSEQLEECE